MIQGDGWWIFFGVSPKVVIIEPSQSHTDMKDTEVSNHGFLQTKKPETFCLVHSNISAVVYKDLQAEWQDSTMGHNTKTG